MPIAHLVIESLTSPNCDHNLTLNTLAFVVPFCMKMSPSYSGGFSALRVHHVHVTIEEPPFAVSKSDRRGELVENRKGNFGSNISEIHETLRFDIHE